jgi:small subunit ribosomal protein S8
MLTQIRNAQSRKREELVLPFSKVLFGIAQILKNAGFVSGVEKRKKKEKKREAEILSVRLKYTNGVGAISGVKLVSKPSRRVYVGKKELKPVASGYGISVVSTSKGLMTGDDARKMGIGGEVICEVW